jgi:hypothetical protein
VKKKHFGVVVVAVAAVAVVEIFTWIVSFLLF